MPPSVETVPVPSRGDAADDAAIWIHPDALERSLVLATDKRSGILVYDLAGGQRQYLPEGNFNNVDLRTGAWGRDDLTIAVASGRQPAELVVFELDHASGGLRLVGRNEQSGGSGWRPVDDRKAPQASNESALDAARGTPAGPVTNIQTAPVGGGGSGP